MFPNSRRYEDLPASGAGVATVLAGDVLARLAKGGGNGIDAVINAPLHRVVTSQEWTSTVT